MYRSAKAAIGCYEASMEFTVPWHRHRALQLNLVARGQATFLVRDRAYRLRQRTALWIFPEEDHILLDASPDFVMWFGYFPRAFVKQCCTSPGSRALLGKRPPSQASRELGPSAGRRLLALFHEIVHETDDPARRHAALGGAVGSALPA
jgi:hypothetical protein